MKREDVLKVDELKEELTTAFRTFERSLRNVFGEMVYAVDTVVEKCNDLEAQQAATQTQLEAMQTRLDGEIATIKRALNLGPSN
jgi:hypothetical protein